ncbi:MAG TPA: nuclear transport factor 2 family protein [Pyrinomonadaceae bacterium]|nr:nuclear transport factor 2 family protein [Pyrinomonadaceae bacterium]
MILLSMLLILLSFPQAPASSTQTASQPALELERRFTTTLLKKDAVELDKLLADDLIHIGFEGQIASKAEYMGFFKQGAWQYQKYEPTNLTVKSLGDVAVVTGLVNRKIIINKVETEGAFAFTHVWSQSGGKWRLTSSHVTTVPMQTRSSS